MTTWMKRTTAGMRWWHAALFGGAFAATVIMMLPARWAASALEHATDGHVRLNGATGSPWRGRGDLVLRSEAGEIVLPGTSWEWLPARLLAGEVAIKLRFAGVATGNVVVARRMTGLVLRDAEISLPAAALAERVGPLRGWGPGGTLVFRTQLLNLGTDGAAGGAQVMWQGASTASAPLGDFLCDLQVTPGMAARVTIATLRGPLFLSADGEVGVGGALRLRGTATSEPAYRAQLGPLLLALGANRGDGAVAFDIALPARGPA